MKLVDVNVLVYAHRKDTPHHESCRRFLDELVNGDQSFGMSELVLSGFLRITTHPRIFNPPTPLDQAVSFVQAIRSRSNHVIVDPGPRHFSIFLGLLKDAGAQGNLIPDAYLAALAIESGCEWITTDRDYARFENLKWSSPISTAESASIQSRTWK